MTESTSALDIVIPVHNEAEGLRSELMALNDVFSAAFPSVRFLVVENGSSDATWTELALIQADWCVPLKSPVADYGAALRLGVRESSAPTLLLAEIDFCDVRFAVSADHVLQQGEVEMVQSSKAAPGAVDRRPLIRRVITWGFNRTLQAAFGFSGTDTHGMKMAKRDALQDLLAQCVLDGNLLATEIVLRAQRDGLHVAEVPVSIEERRATSIGILKRVPSTLRDLARLRSALRE